MGLVNEPQRGSLELLPGLSFHPGSNAHYNTADINKVFQYSGAVWLDQGERQGPGPSPFFLSSFCGLHTLCPVLYFSAIRFG